MYLLLPAVFLFLFRFKRKRYLRLTGLVALAVALGRLSYVWPPDTGLFSFFPCFMGGVIAYELRKTFAAVLPAWSWPPAMGLIGVLYVAKLNHGDDIRFQWLLGLVVGIVIPFFRDLRDSMLTVPAERIARYSYGIYLSHTTLIWIFLVYFKVSPVLAWPLFILSISFVPAALYYLIESPMIALGSRLTGAPPRRQPGAVTTPLPVPLNDLPVASR